MSYTKTNWVNNSSPKINQTNLNNMENGIYNNDSHIGDLTQLLTTDKSNLVNAINETKGITKWTNSALTSSFPAQTITIPIDLSSGSSFSYYELVYSQSTTRDDRQFTTGKLRYDCGSIMMLGTGVTRAYDILITTVSETEIQVGFVFESAKDSGGNVVNTNLIPVKIKMYKGED